MGLSSQTTRGDLSNECTTWHLFSTAVYFILFQFVKKFSSEQQAYQLGWSCHIMGLKNCQLLGPELKAWDTNVGFHH